jgi:hypothetical protein
MIDRTSGLFVWCGEKIKTKFWWWWPASKKCRQGCGGDCDSVWWSLHLVGVWSQVDSSVLVCLAGISPSSQLFCFLSKVESVIGGMGSRDNAAANCNDFQGKKFHSHQLWLVIHSASTYHIGCVSQEGVCWVQTSYQGARALICLVSCNVREMQASHFGEYENDYCLRECCTVQSGRSLRTFQRCLLPPSWGRS